MTESPRSELFDDVYFSAEDGAEETRHVFLDGNGLPARWQGCKRFAIGETGFGTGLNFLMAWELFDRTADRGAFLDFISVEKHPLDICQIRKALSPWADRLGPYLEKLLARYPMRIPGFHRIVFDSRVALTLVFGDANEILPEIEGNVDAWFLDGFTPSKNPEMWTDKVFHEIARLSAPEASLATFTAAGFVKRGLRAAGFDIEKKKGFGWKRDMLVGRYERPDKPAPKQCPDGAVTILGAGLAGAACAHVLPQYGIDIVLCDPNGVASGASGNALGLINPRFTAFRTAQSDFYGGGFALATRTFAHFPDASFAPSGNLHLINDAEKAKRFHRTLENWGWGEDHMRLLSADEASDAAGISIGAPALYLPDGGQIDPSVLCRAYVGDTAVTSAPPPESAVTIYACGAGSLSLAALSGLPLETVRGQITFVRQTERSAPLKVNIGYGGYVSAARNGLHAVGSTFQKWRSDTTSDDEDDCANLENLSRNVPALGSFAPVSSRASLRTASKDRFPIVGAMQGGFVTTAHGSHGLISTLIAAHLLADMIRGGTLSLGKTSVSALSPDRFSKASLPSNPPHG